MNDNFYAQFAENNNWYRSNFTPFGARSTAKGMVTLVPIPGHDANEVSWERDGQFAWINVKGNDLFQGTRHRIDMWYDIKDEQVEILVKDGICFVWIRPLEQGYVD